MRVSLVLLGSCLVGLAGAFSPTPSSLSCSNTVGSKNLKLIAPPRDSLALRFASLNNSDNDSDDVSPDIHNKFDLSSTFSKTASTTLISWLATTGMASADSPDWGLFEGRTGSILHPITMGGLFGLSLYTAYLGFQWRRQRTLGDEISSLKKQMPNLGSYKTIQEALDSGEMDSSEEAQLKAAIPVEKEMNDLTAERKELASQGNRDKHYLQGTIIAFLGTVFAIEVSLFDRMFDCCLSIVLTRPPLLLIYHSNNRDHSIPMLVLENSFQVHIYMPVQDLWFAGPQPWRVFHS